MFYRLFYSGYQTAVYHGRFAVDYHWLSDESCRVICSSSQRQHRQSEWTKQSTGRCNFKGTCNEKACINCCSVPIRFLISWLVFCTNHWSFPPPTTVWLLSCLVLSVVSFNGYQRFMQREWLTTRWRLCNVGTKWLAMTSAYQTA